MGNLNCHYVPFFQLQEFKDEGGLHRLYIKTGEHRRKAPEKVGFVKGLYPDELEQGLLQNIDSEVAKIFQKWIRGRKVGDTIILRPWQRKRLAEWMALATVRTPKRLHIFKKTFATVRETPQASFRVVDHARTVLVEHMRKKLPDVFNDSVRQLGRAEAENLVVAAAARLVYNGQIDMNPSENPFGRYITEERISTLARYLLKLDWTWFFSPSGFVVGDSPLSSIHLRDLGHDYGIGMQGVEATYPFSRTLCVRMRRGNVASGTVQLATNELTREFNRRQWRSSHEQLFGPSKQIEIMAGWIKRHLAKQNSI